MPYSVVSSVPKKNMESTPVSMTEMAVAYPLSTASANLSTAATVNPPIALLNTESAATPLKLCLVVAVVVVVVAVVVVRGWWWWSW